MHAAAFLSRSNHGVYYARFVVPLQRLTPGDSREFRLSTGTKDPRAARALARHLRVCFEQYLMENATYRREHAIAYLRAHMPKRPDQPMGFGVKRTETGYELTDLTPTDAKALAAGDMDDLLAHLDSRWNTAQPAPIAQVPTPGKEPNPAPRPGAGAGDETGAGQSPQPKAAPRRSRLRVERLAKEFVEYEAERATGGELASKEIKKITTRLKPFLEYFQGREINDLTPFDMEQFARAMAYYPIFLDDISEAKGMKLGEIIAKTKAGTLMTNDGEPALTITKNTHAGYMQIPKNFIKYCNKRNLGSTALVGGLSAPVPNLREGTKRRAFLKEELQKIFNSEYYREARYNTSYQYWVPLIAAFTGARVNEIAQLQPTDVKQDDEGLWYFDITDDDTEGKKSLKTQQSKRIVPLHQVLLNLGLVEYVKSKKKENAANLFDITPERADRHGRTPARWFNAEYLREYLKIEDPAVTFHSFRHRFITSMHQAIFDASDIKGELIASTTPALILRWMVGHSDLSLMTAGRSKDVHTDTYTGALSVKSMKKVIDLLQYSGVRFWGYTEPQEGKRQRKKSPDAFEISGEDLANIL